MTTTILATNPALLHHKDKFGSHKGLLLLYLNKAPLKHETRLLTCYYNQLYPIKDIKCILMIDIIGISYQIFHKNNYTEI